MRQAAQLWKRFTLSEAVLLPTDRLMMVLPALCIPPWQVLDVTSQAVTISLQVLEEGGGANTLNLDELFLTSARFFSASYSGGHILSEYHNRLRLWVWSDGE